MRKLQQAALVLGLFAGGVAVGQAFDFNSLVTLLDSKDDAIPEQAKQLLTDYGSAVGSAKSSPQVSQVADETLVRMHYLEIRQNAQIIALLKQLAAKK